MISFDTFTGEAHDVIDEQRDGTIRDSDEPLHRRRTSRRSARGRRSRRSDVSVGGAVTPSPRSYATAAGHGTDDENDFSDDGAAHGSGDGRVYQLFQLLSLKNHTGDAKRALVQRLLGVSNVNELVLSKATEDQIASAANDAITDEILATVDQEDKRRQSESDGGALVAAAAAARKLHNETSATAATMATTTATSTALVVASHDAGPYSTYRVLELVDVLDSTTGGMVKRILTNVRRRQRGGSNGSSATWRKSEFCGFCVDYRTHNTAQHKCRICGVLGAHRSQFCPQAKAPSSSSSSRPPTPRTGGSGASTPRSRRRTGSATPSQLLPTDDEVPPSSTASRLTPDASDKSFCTFCSTWGFHSTENHRCRICGIQGEHRSRHCTKKSSSDGYRWRGSPAETTATDRKFCDLCGSLRNHATDEHRCRICLKLGEHRSKNCPMHTPTPPTGNASAAASPQVPPPPPPLPLPRPPSRGRLTPRSGSYGSGSVRTFCSFCAKDVAHRSEEHICRICRATGLHRSGDCPARGSRAPPSSSQSVLSYSVETASKVRDRVLETIPLVLPTSASTLVMDSIDKVGDVDTILRRTLQRIGVWGGGSQTPITTPYAPPAAPSTSLSSLARSRQSSAAHDVPLPALQNVDGQGVYVVSYAEGRSVVPERILKYMRLLMHHEISTNAFSVVVVFDPRPSTWELEKPGMVTPRSLPSSPTMSEQLKKRMAKYTLQTLLGAREKLVKLVVAQKRMQIQQPQPQPQPSSQHQQDSGAHTVQAAS